MFGHPRPDPVGPGQESVWDYPRPPALRACTESIEVILGGSTICRTIQSFQVLETSHPPTYYLPSSAFVDGSLRQASGHSLCEWKGQANYLDLVGGEQVATRAGWYYPDPTPRFAELRDHLALYPGLMDQVTVDGEQVVPQPGGFYGGWVTAKVSGPFKGGPGSMGW